VGNYAKLAFGTLTSTFTSAPQTAEGIGFCTLCFKRISNMST